MFSNFYCTFEIQMESKKLKTKNVFEWLFFGASILFLILFGLLAYHNRPATDDFLYSICFKDNGVLGCMNQCYQVQTFRWAGMLLMGILFKLNDFVSQFPLYHISLFSLFIVVIALWIRLVFQKFFQISFSKKTIFAISVLIFASFYFLTFHAVELFFWYCGSVYYLQNIVAALFGFYFIFRKKKSFIDYLLIPLCFLYAGGTIENLAFCYIVILSIIFLYFIQIKKKDASFNLLLKVIIAFIFLVSSVLINISGSGFQVRQELSAIEKAKYGEEKNGFYKIEKASLIKLSKKIKDRKLLIYLILVLPAIGIGTIAKSNNPNNSFKVKKIIFSLIASNILVLILSILPFIIMLGNLGTERTWVLFFFTANISILTLLFLIGFKIPDSKGFSLFRLTLIGITFIVALFYIFRQYPVISAYSEAYDLRKTQLEVLQKSNFKETVVVKKLPPSGPLLSADDNFDYFSRQYSFALLLKNDEGK